MRFTDDLPHWLGFLLVLVVAIGISFGLILLTETIGSINNKMYVKILGKIAGVVVLVFLAMSIITNGEDTLRIAPNNIIASIISIVVSTIVGTLFISYHFIGIKNPDWALWERIFEAVVAGLLVLSFYFPCITVLMNPEKYDDYSNDNNRMRERN